MLRQIRYFQAVVRNHSFSRAAEECHISQSAISQQLRALEEELGFALLNRRNRTFTLTPAGEYFYQKSLILVEDYDRVCREAQKIARGGRGRLRLGFLRGYMGTAFERAVEGFARAYPEVELEITGGTHEELFALLQTDGLDLTLNDQRRAFSEAYVNLLLVRAACCIAVSRSSPLAVLTQIGTEELKNTPCILIASREQWEHEQSYYREILGLPGEFLRSENLEEARLLAAGSRGFLLTEEAGGEEPRDSLVRIPLMRGQERMTRNYCAFWKKDNSGYYVEEFADLLKEQFQKEQE